MQACPRVWIVGRLACINFCTRAHARLNVCRTPLIAVGVFIAVRAFEIALRIAFAQSYRRGLRVGTGGTTDERADDERAADFLTDPVFIELVGIAPV